MEILSAIVQILGGLALFLYGIELMGDGLKNSSGAALKRVLEKVTGNVVMGVLTGALVTAVIQSSTATIVLTVALIGAGVLNLRQAVSIVMGANIGTTVTAQIIRLGSIQSDGSWLLWLFDTDTLAPIALIIGIVLLMFIKSKRSNTIGDICIGFGILFVGLNLMTSGVEPLVGTDAFIAFVRFLNNPLFGILFGLVLTVIVQSSSATVGMLQTVASVPGAGITFAMAYPVIMGINLGTCVTTAMVCSIGSSKDAKRTGVVHIAFNTIGTILFLLLMTVLRKLSVFSAEFWVRSVDSGNIANFQTIFNLSNAALTSGLEWNTKVTRRDLPETIDKIAATFEYYWNDREFEYYEEEQKERLARALKAEKYFDTNNAEVYTMDINPYAYQQEILDKLEAERAVRGYMRNLIVAATGTGKTVISAVCIFYNRLHLPQANLLS